MKLVELSDLGRTVTGKTPSSNNPEDFGDRYCFVTPTDSLQLKFIEKTDRSLSQLGADRLKGKLLPPKSVMVSCIGSAMGKVVMNRRPCVTNQQFNSIVVDQAHYSPDYVYYALKNNYRMLRNAATGSTALPLLNKTDFDRLKLRVHADKDEQVKVSSILSALDAKIELNNRINAELEGMAKLLYDYWFVQFDFPMTAAQAAALGKPHLAGHPYRASGGKMIHNETLKRDIPEGWTDGSLEKLGKIIGGSTPSTEVPEYFSTEGTPWITPKDLSDNIGNRFIQRGAMGVTEKGIKAASLKLLPAGTVLMSSRAPIGYLAVPRNPVTTNQGFKSIVPENEFTTDYIYFTLKHFMKLIQANASGSTFKEISGGTLKAVKIHLPPDELLKKFTEFSSSLSSQQSVLERQNQELTQLRDWLLPMLMNGQVTVG